MPPRSLRSTLVAAAVLGLAPPVLAQTLLEQPRRRQGYYVSLGLAAAIDHNWQDGESLGTWGGQMLSIRLGEMVTRRFGLGLRLDQGVAASGPQSAALVGLGIEAQWQLAGNLAVHGTAGLGVVRLKDTRDQDGKLHGTVGSGYTLGLSYDWFLGHRSSGGFAVTPMLAARLVPGSTATALVGVVGVELTYWTGLPREQLQLPPGEAW
jgi:hypothetical protein